ncbi:integrase, catalytic region, zinc finger, CCHC-type containing protein [Tanacetum coccineum]|uniref:Integrase, catalytic region, zinc finger, CCHC-type containing protein n=1 Tax=Tanacetum coccineum TaxID=301880 RepID=A0ABQ5CTZ0_9ASTR
MIDSQMDDMIREKLALKEQINSFEQNLSKQIKEKKSLFKTFTVFKNKYKEKENKYMEMEIDLEKKIKELDNIICKVGQSAQTVHMLTKLQAFYDNTHKQALGYQNPFYLKKAQRIKPTLYDGVVMSNTHVAIPVIDDEETLILEEEIVEQAKAKQPLDRELNFTCKHATRIQELLVYVQDTCPNAITSGTRKVAVTPMNNVKKVRFAEPFTSSSNIKQVESSNTSDSNTLVLSSTGVKCSTSNCGSKPPGNKKNDRILQSPSRNKKNKVEAQPRKVNKMNHVVKPVCDVDVKHSLSNANSKILCATCNKSMFDGVHDKCLLDLVQNGNNHTKSAKKHKKQNIWKPTGHVFTEVGLKWKPTGRTFTIVGNSCPLTRFTSTNVVPPKQTTSHSDEIQKPEIKVYSRKPKNVKNIGSSKMAKIVESKNANHSEPNHTWGSNATDIPLSSSLVMTGCPDCTLVSGLRIFGNDQIARIMGYGDYQLGNVVISRVYYVEGLGHNLFSVGQFCDADLEVAFRKNTCFIRNLEGVDLLSGSRDTNLYTISLDDMLKSSPICLLSKASKTKSWLWHRRLSHLNFGTLNKLAKDGLA